MRVRLPPRPPSVPSGARGAAGHTRSGRGRGSHSVPDGDIRGHRTRGVRASLRPQPVRRFGGPRRSALNAPRAGSENVGRQPFGYRILSPVWRKLRWVMWAGIAGGVVLVLASTATVLWPHRDHPDRADAVVVLSGDHGERLALAKRILQAGVAPTLVMAGSPDSLEAEQLCQGGRSFEVVCLRPEPDSTRAEARATAALASRRHWRTVVVVTSTQHVTRARLLFSRCLTGRLQVVGANLPFGGFLAVQARVHEVLGLLYARIWARGC